MKKKIWKKQKKGKIQIHRKLCNPEIDTLKKEDTQSFSSQEGRPSWLPWKWNFCFLENDKNKQQKHRRMLFKPKANQQWLKNPNRGGAGRIDANNQWVYKGSSKSENKIQWQLYRDTDAQLRTAYATTPPRRYTIARIHVQTRGREEEQPMTKHHWQTACFYRPPPPEEQTTISIKKKKILVSLWHTPFPFSQSRAPAPGLAWPEFLHWPLPGL